MKKNIAFLALFLVLATAKNARAVIEVRGTVDNFCWKDADDKTTCLKDYKDQVRVLLFNAGWCPPCNSEFAELAPKIPGYANKKVVFLSLSSGGWTRGSEPNAQFLKEWKARHKLNFNANKITFHVLAAPNDYGKSFQARPAIPNVAIVGKDGKLAYKAIAPDSDDLFSAIDEALK